MKNKRVIITLISTIVISSIFTMGCSKKETYTITSKDTLEVGVDIPEGTYIVKQLESTNNGSNNAESVGVIEDEDGEIVAVSMDLANFKEYEIKLEKGTIFSSSTKTELIPK